MMWQDNYRIDEKLMKSFDHTEDEYIQHLVSALVHETDSVLESTCAQAVARGDFGAVAEELANDGMMIAQRISGVAGEVGNLLKFDSRSDAVGFDPSKQLNKLLSKQVQYAYWTPIFRYLREALRWCWVVPGFWVPKPVTYAICQFLGAGLTGFVEPFLSLIWLQYGLHELNLDISIMCGVGMCCSRMFIWRSEIIYSGRWDVQRTMQQLLIRKYLELDEFDSASKESFREAILRTSVDVRHRRSNSGALHALAC
jgi:hypothetical protein